MSKRILVQRFGQLAALVGLTCLVAIAAGRHPNAAAAALRDKHARLATSPSPKVVLVGGSNVTYGLASDVLEQRLGRPVVNMGYTVGVGLRFMLADVEADVHSGDIVVLVPEYELFQDLVAGNGDALNVILQHPSSVEAVSSWGEVARMIEFLPVTMQINVKRYLLSPVTGPLLGVTFDTARLVHRDGFDAQGDLVSYLDQPPATKVEFDPLTPDLIDERAVAILSDFQQRFGARGVKLILIFPALGAAMFEASRPTIDRIERTLRTTTSLAIPSNPERYVFPQDSLFDSIYHLRREARPERTRRLAEDLCPFVDTCRR